MGNRGKSQWDFGELFPPEQLRKVFSVQELTAKVRRVLEKEFGRIWIEGEVANLRVQSSGHIYFTLKDAIAQLSCVLFRGENQVERELLQDGRKVVLGGELTVYEARGQYQLRVTAVEAQGLGALQAAFEKLKQKLKAEGLFEPARKRALPRFPQRIGVVTSPTGAALHDVLHVIERRNPGLELILAPCRVQGVGAAEELAFSVRMLNRFHQAECAAGRPGLDVLLLTRGGGSIEDLWAFNEEVVARAVFDSALPVVSAVGHEIDFTISDFVADLRAATPSAAAEILTEGVFSSCQFLEGAGERLRVLARQRMQDKAADLGEVSRRLARLHPRRRLQDWQQRLDDLQDGMLRCCRQGLRQQRTAAQTLSQRLSRVRPGLALQHRREVFTQAAQRLFEQARHRLREAQNRADALQGRLRLLGPEQVLARGYSITMDAESGVVLRDAGAVKRGKVLKTRLKSGELRSRVEE